MVAALQGFQNQHGQYAFRNFFTAREDTDRVDCDHGCVIPGLCRVVALPQGRILQQLIQLVMADFAVPTK